MERPNRIVNMRIGTQLETGTACGSPSRPVPQPHWKIATMTP
jgi:hypothetical protein